MSLPLPAADAPLLPELAAFRRPRLRGDVPILWREQNCIQLGDEVVVDRVSRTHVAWLTSLDGLRAPEDIERDLELPVHEARRLLRALLAAAALDDAARIPDAMRWAAQEERDVTVQRFGAALRTYRDLDTAFDAMAGRDRCRIAVIGDGHVANHLSGALEAAGLQTSDASHASLTILADAVHPDVPVHFDHEVQQRPHLPVTVLGDRASIGPLVIPGHTGCLRCAHLHRRDADAAWPLLAVQWSQALTTMPCPPVDPLLARLAAAQAALLVRTWADAPDQLDLWSGFALELRLPHGTAQRVPRQAHPLCGCRWPAA